MEVLVVEGVWDVEVDDASGVGVAFCVDEVSGAGDADTGGEDDETCAGFVVGVEVAAFAEVEGGGVPVTIVVPLCGTGSALCASQVLSTCYASDHHSHMIRLIGCRRIRRRFSLFRKEAG